LRLHPDKANVLILDYAGNIARHFPNGNVFEPKIKARGGRDEIIEITAKCPACGHKNQFIARENEGGFLVDDEGYFADLSGARIEPPMPAHYGRRCRGVTIIKGESVRCEHRWEHKLCDACGGENDIAARYCEHCRAEIIDPNEKLRREAAKAETERTEFLGRPTRIRIERSKAGDRIVARYTLDVDGKRRYASEVFSPGGEHQWMVGNWREFSSRAVGRVLRFDELPAEAVVLPRQIKARLKNEFWNVTSKKW
jgi:hypothetical protein